MLNQSKASLSEPNIWPLLMKILKKTINKFHKWSDLLYYCLCGLIDNSKYYRIHEICIVLSIKSNSELVSFYL